VTAKVSLKTLPTAIQVGNAARYLALAQARRQDFVRPFRPFTHRRPKESKPAPIRSHCVNGNGNAHSEARLGQKNTRLGQKNNGLFVADLQVLHERVSRAWGF
jgi:hypothetical protein